MDFYLSTSARTFPCCQITQLMFMHFSSCRVLLYGGYPLFIKLSKDDNEIRYSTASVVLLIEFGKVSEYYKVEIRLTS